MTLNMASNNQICGVIVLSIALFMISGAWGRQDVGSPYAQPGVGMAGAPLYMTRNNGGDMQQVLLNELLTNVNEDALYNELQKYHRQQPNYLSKWPGLRDLLLTADYDENVADSSIDNENSNEAVNSRFVERLRHLAASAVDDMEDARADSHATGLLPEVLPTAMPLKRPSPPAPGNKISFKEHGIKKNVQYMSPCHFKICNMGRKRNARFYDY